MIVTTVKICEISKVRNSFTIITTCKWLHVHWIKQGEMLKRHFLSRKKEAKIIILKKWAHIQFSKTKSNLNQTVYKNFHLDDSQVPRVSLKLLWISKQSYLLAPVTNCSSSRRSESRIRLTTIVILDICVLEDKLASERYIIYDSI